MRLPVDSLFGVYQVRRLIGAGGMGEVYEAHDTQLKRAVALKILSERVAADSDRLARFTREARVLASPTHSNIATLYGFEIHDGVAALVMELVEGPTLADRLVRGALPLHEAVPIARQIADALEAAHDRHVVHRDLKPAKHGVLGTVAYVSAEVVAGASADARADVWAFGCVLYEMLTGARAFSGRDSSEVLVAVTTAEPDWSRVPPGLGPVVLASLRACLRKDPRQRLRDIRDVRLMLDGPIEIDGADTRATAARGWRHRSLHYAARLLW